LTTFTDLGLNPTLLATLKTEGYTQPTPIQAQAVPSLLTGRDLLGIAQTGTGKTAAFALPILHRLAADYRPAPRKGCRVLVLSPTRELAGQIAGNFKTYASGTKLRVAVVFGGVASRPQVNAMARGVDILVATPGRLIDHMEGRAIDLSATEIVVLDEADQMLDMGFIKPIRQIVGKLPKVRQTLLFSATMPAEIDKLAAGLLHRPVRVNVTPPAKTADLVQQRIIHIEARKKAALLGELFADPALSRAIVFTRTKRGADKVAKRLGAAGVKVSAIHGNKSQGQRQVALREFRDGKIRALVATDIAARGIDVDNISHVVNFDIPNIPESYVHRIGRTARAGTAGIAISLCCGEERGYLRDIERITRQTIPSEDRRGDETLAADTRDVEPVKPQGRSQARPGTRLAAKRSGNGPRHNAAAHAKPANRTARNGDAGRNSEPSRDLPSDTDHREGRNRAEPTRADGHRGKPQHPDGRRKTGHRKGGNGGNANPTLYR